MLLILSLLISLIISFVIYFIFSFVFSLLSSLFVSLIISFHLLKNIIISSNDLLFNFFLFLLTNLIVCFNFFNLFASESLLSLLLFFFLYFFDLSLLLLKLLLLSISFLILYWSNPSGKALITQFWKLFLISKSGLKVFCSFLLFLWDLKTTLNLCNALLYFLINLLSSLLYFLSISTLLISSLLLSISSSSIPLILFPLLENFLFFLFFILSSECVISSSKKSDFKSISFCFLSFKLFFKFFIPLLSISLLLSKLIIFSMSLYVLSSLGFIIFSILSILSSLIKFSLLLLLLLFLLWLYFFFFFPFLSLIIELLLFFIILFPSDSTKSMPVNLISDFESLSIPILEKISKLFVISSFGSEIFLPIGIFFISLISSFSLSLSFFFNFLSFDLSSPFLSFILFFFFIFFGSDNLLLFIELSIFILSLEYLKSFKLFVILLRLFLLESIPSEFTLISVLNFFVFLDFDLWLFPFESFDILILSFTLSIIGIIFSSLKNGI